MLLNAPCLDCPRRHKGCHAGCGDYKAFQAENAKARKARNDEGSARDAWMKATVLRNMRKK